MSESKNTQIVLLDSEKVIEMNNNISLVDMNKRLTVQQLRLFCFAVMKVEGEGSTSTFTKSEIEDLLEIPEYKQIRFMKDLRELTNIEYLSCDENFNYNWKGGVIVGKFMPKYQLDDETITCFFDSEFIEDMKNLVGKYMTLDLKMLVHFKSAYSWYLYVYLKSKYQSNVHIKHKKIQVSKLKKILKCDDIPTYESFKYFRYQVLDPAIKEINRYTELSVEYKTVKTGRTVTDIEFNWTIQPTLYSATNAQKEYIEQLSKDLFSRDEFLETEKSFARYLRKIELEGLTKENAKIIITKAKDTIAKLSNTKPKALDLDNEQTIEKIRIGVQDKLRETFSATAAEFFGGNFFDKGLEKAKENMDHKDSIQSVVIYITKAIKTMIYEEQKE